MPLDTSPARIQFRFYCGNSRTKLEWNLKFSLTLWQYMRVCDETIELDQKSSGSVQSALGIQALQAPPALAYLTEYPLRGASPAPAPTLGPISIGAVPSAPPPTQPSPPMTDLSPIASQPPVPTDSAPAQPADPPTPPNPLPPINFQPGSPTDGSPATPPERSPPAENMPKSQEEAGSSRNITFIAGAAAATVVLLVLCAVVLLFVMARRRKQRGLKQADTAAAPSTEKVCTHP